MARKPKKMSTDTTKTVVILPGLYNETLTLLADAHDYFYRFGEKAQVNMTARERTMFASEMSRITIRLSCVMAWLMVRKAVLAGKMTEEDANAKYKLDCRDVSLNQHIEAETILPEKMTGLLDRTFELYQRVARLDDLTSGAKQPT